MSSSDEFSESSLSRLTAEVGLLKKLFREQVNMGDHLLTHVDPVWAAQNGIQPVVRTAIIDGDREQYAAPAAIDYTNPYSYETRNMFAFANAFASGQKGTIPSYMFDPVPIPILKKTKKLATFVGTIEKMLFERLSFLGNGITAVNPSCTTMGVLKKFSGKVFLTSQDYGKWFPVVDDFVRKTNGRLQIVDSPVGIQYLGCHSPSYLPKGDWYYLLPNPYVPHEYVSWDVISDDDGVLMKYTTKEQERAGVLKNDLPYYVYNPSTLQALSGNDKYILVSNFPFPFLTEVETMSTYHTPWFLDAYPDAVAIEGSQPIYHCAQRVVYDVDGPGTYLSRRARITLPDGYSWAPFTVVGPYSFSRFSLAPTLKNNVRLTQEGDTRYIVYGEQIVVSSLRPSFQRASLVDDGSSPFIEARGGKVWLGNVGMPFSFLGNTSVVILHKDLIRRVHVYCPSDTGSYHNSLLPRGNYFVFNSIQVRGVRGDIVTHVVHEPVGPELWIFGLDSRFSRHILQHRVNTLQWSCVDSSRRTDLDLEAARPRGTVESALQMMSFRTVSTWNDPGMVYSDILFVFPQLTEVRAQTFFRSSPDIVLWRNDADFRKNQYVRTSSIQVIQESVPGLQVKNNETVRSLFESLVTGNFHVWRFVPTKDFGVITKIIRNMGWAVLFSPIGDVEDGAVRTVHLRR